MWWPINRADGVMIDRIAVTSAFAGLLSECELSDDGTVCARPVFAQASLAVIARRVGVPLKDLWAAYLKNSEAVGLTPCGLSVKTGFLLYRPLVLPAGWDWVPGSACGVFRT